MHYKIDLQSLVVIGRDGVPAALAGLPNDILADPAAHIVPCPRDFAGFGWWPVHSEVPDYDQSTQRLSGQIDETPDPTTKTVTVRPLVVNLTPAELEARLIALRAERKSAATALRWEKETGGILIGGVPVATDDRSKTLILGKRAQAQSNPTMSFRWKAASGDWVDLTGAQIIAIADAVGDHVQACFDREGELQDLIDAAETAGDALAVDIATGWP